MDNTLDYLYKGSKDRYSASVFPVRPLWGECPVTNALSSVKLTFSPLSHLIFSSAEHAQGELLENLCSSSVVRVDVQDVRPSTFCVCILQRAQF